MPAQPIQLQGKVIGLWDTESKTFEKKVKGSKHLMVVLDAWGIDKGILERIHAKSGTLVINDTETGETYTAHSDLYKEKGIERTFGNHGTQIFLPRQYFAKSATGQDGMAL